jgi:multimeric flavodoxin WrbA
MISYLEIKLIICASELNKDPKMTTTLLIISYSKKGATEKMATEIARGARDAGLNVVSKSVVDCTIADMLAADGIAFGSPTYYSNIAWQPKKFLDETILEFYSKGYSLKGKVCGCFTSTGGYFDGRECLRMLELAFGYALKMRMVSGVVLESKDVVEGNVSNCYDLGKRIAQELVIN